jgi:hypothetical protein
MVLVAALAANGDGSPPAAAITETLAVDQFASQRRQALVLPLSPPILDCDVLAFNAQALPEDGNDARVRCEKPNNGLRRL